MFTVRPDPLTDPATLALIALHQREMLAGSPEGKCFALDLSGLQSPDITLWSAWSADHRIAAIGALRRLPAPDAHLGELKSMRTHPDFLRRGAGALILDTIIATAQHEGLTHLALETGSGASFEPALALYRRRGFANGGPFGDYTANGFNQFLWLDLTTA
jgi:putative acetyltransferase